MSSWLTDLTAACCTQLGTVGDKLDTLKDRYIYWNDDYYQKAQNLVGQRQYQGKGAIAFMQAVDTDINVCRPVYDGIGHASSACHNLQNAMKNSSSTYDNEMASLYPPYEQPWQIDWSVFDNWRNQLIQMTLTHIGGGGNNADILGSILQDGNSSIYGSYNNAYQTVEGLVKEDADTYAQIYIGEWLPQQHSGNSIEWGKLDNYGYNYSSSPQEPTIDPQQLMKITVEMIQIKQEILAYYLSAFNQLSNDVERSLTNWAVNLFCAHEDFQYAIQHSENYLSARDLFDFIQNDDGQAGLYNSQSTTKPITITPYKTKNGTGLLISIGGTDLNDMAWDTDIFTALQTGMGMDNPFLADVKQAILNYMQEHQEMTGSEITFAGYSLGGMTAQQMAQDITGGNDRDLKNYNLHVAQVITYGAPVMGPRLGNNVQYNMYDATYDPVPLLSQYENPTVNASLLLKGGVIDAGMAVSTLNAADQMGWDERLHTYIDPSGQYAGAYS